MVAQVIGSFIYNGDDFSISDYSNEFDSYSNLFRSGGFEMKIDNTISIENKDEIVEVFLNVKLPKALCGHEGNCIRIAIKDASDSNGYNIQYRWIERTGDKWDLYQKRWLLLELMTVLVFQEQSSNENINRLKENLSNNVPISEEELQFSW